MERSQLVKLVGAIRYPLWGCGSISWWIFALDLGTIIARCVLWGELLIVDIVLHLGTIARCGNVDGWGS